jgi:insulysin
MGLRILIQSLSDPTVLDERIDDFLVSLRSLLVEMSEDAFTSQKEGLIAKKLEGHKNLIEEESSLWGHIQSGYYDFLQCSYCVSVLRWTL